MQDSKNEFLFDRAFHPPAFKPVHKLLLLLLVILQIVQVVVEGGLVGFRPAKLQQILSLESQKQTRLLAEKQVFEQVQLVLRFNDFAHVKSGLDSWLTFFVEEHHLLFTLVHCTTEAREHIINKG